MKKKLLIFLSILTLLLFIVFPIDKAEAERGCCSWHGGVCCGCGPQSNGRVICNDGWRGSSCFYSEMVMCRGYLPPPPPPPPPPSPCEDVIYSYDYSKPILRMGSRGYWVVELQKKLNYALYRTTNDLVLDGAFGPKTNHAVKYFQQYCNITVDGIVGPQTWGLLNAVCNQ